jgi:amidohydrolase
MNVTKKLIRERAASLAPRTIEIRRQLHRRPELSFREIETSAYIASVLKDAGIPFEAMPGADGNGTGLVAEIEGTAPAEGIAGSVGAAPAIALRADMDALPIIEENDIDFRSENHGVMHACGHDAHSAVVLTAGMILHGIRDRFSGRIRLIFQPGEEKSPGGAKSLIEQGALDGIGRILGEHINPSLPAGTVGFRPGLMMASADEIYLTVTGRGGHAASPHTLIDPVLITSHIIVSLQQIVSRRADPEVPSVLSFGQVRADGAMNVIPDRVSVAGTFRTVDEAWRETALNNIRQIAKSLAEGMGGGCEVEIIRGYPVLENDEELTARSRAGAVEYLGEENVLDLPLVMWAEDFAYYNREVPGCFYNLGVSNASRGWTSPLHSSTLMIDESALETGSGLMAWLALRELADMADNSGGELQAGAK